MLDTTTAAVAEEEKQNAMMFFQMASQLDFVDNMELFRTTAEKMFDIPPQELDLLVQQAQPQMGPEEMMGMPGMGMPEMEEQLPGPQLAEIGPVQVGTDMGLASAMGSELPLMSANEEPVIQ